MKGYSLDSHTMRNMCENVLDAAHNQGLHIVCSTFYGQWISLAVQDRNCDPLTQIHMQGDVEASARIMTRQNICQYPKTYSPSLEEIQTTMEKGVLVLSFSL